MAGSDFTALIKRVVELVKPDLRHYYRVVRKARVTATYASDGKYWADVQPLRNDESVDPDEPVIPKVEIPIYWGGPKRGLVCPPEAGTYCDLEYYDGDPNYPRISNFRWHEHAAPDVEIGGLIIQREPGTHIKIDAENNIIHVTPTDRKSDIGGDRTEAIGGDKTTTVQGTRTETVQGSRGRTVAGKEDINVGQTWTLIVGAAATIQAPLINLVGSITNTAVGGGIADVSERSHRQHTGSYALAGPMAIAGDAVITGNLTVNGNIEATGSNPNHHEHE
jgi:hypothetical protein